MLGIFNVRTEVTACDCTRDWTDTVREYSLKVDSGRKIPCRTGGIESVFQQAEEWECSHMGLNIKVNSNTQRRYVKITAPGEHHSVKMKYMEVNEVQKVAWKCWATKRMKSVSHRSLLLWSSVKSSALLLPVDMHSWIKQSVNSKEQFRVAMKCVCAVSYTHLTLPTSDGV